jgi:hypothetical protein
VVREDQPERECGGWDQRRPGNRICKRVCKPDRTGRGETGETHKTAGDCCRRFAEAKAVIRDRMRRQRQPSFVS